MNPRNHNFPPMQVEEFQVPQVDLGQMPMPDLNFVRPNLDVTMQAPNDLSALPEAGQAAPSVFQRQAAPADRFASVNAAARGNVAADLPMPVSADAARRTLDKAGITSDVASKWRETAQAQWVQQNGYNPKAARIQAAMAHHHERTLRMLIDDSEKTEDKE